MKTLNLDIYQEYSKAELSKEIIFFLGLEREVSLFRFIARYRLRRFINYLCSLSDSKA